MNLGPLSQGHSQGSHGSARGGCASDEPIECGTNVFDAPGTLGTHVPVSGPLMSCTSHPGLSETWAQATRRQRSPLLPTHLLSGP